MYMRINIRQNKYSIYKLLQICCNVRRAINKADAVGSIMYNSVINSIQKVIKINVDLKLLAANVEVISDEVRTCL